MMAIQMIKILMVDVAMISSLLSENAHKNTTGLF
jgi:hypothetical protein